MKATLLILSLLLIIPGQLAQAEGYIGITQQSEYTPTIVELPAVDNRPKRIGSSIKFSEPEQAQTAPVDGSARMVESAPSDPRDKAYKGKVDKIDKWTKTAYGLLNDGSQEKWTQGLEAVYEEQVREIKAGGLGYRPEYKKFIEKKMPKIEND